ncbi:MAG: hypothetical protein HUJ26_23245 [Planctomycetaceae bacterium]|nr:hypothetical protein [Planctomycetaceae bacterium]
MSNHKLLSLMALAGILSLAHNSAQAQWFSGGYTTYYAPQTTYYGGWGGGSYGSACCGTGTQTTYYGGGYGNNPFAPLVPSPWPRLGLFRAFRGYGYTAGYAPSGCGCSPCATSNCAGGNCGLTTNQPLKPTPDTPPMTEEEDFPRTYDDTDTPPMDDPNFRPSNPEGSSEENGTFPGMESFKPPVEETENPANESAPTVPLDANPAAAPNDQFDFDIPKPITPRNSAEYTPTRHLDHKITYRSTPVLVPQRQAVATSRPLIVRKTVRVVPTKPLTMVSDSRSVK